MRKHLLLFLLFVLPSLAIWAQQKTITGTITDDNGKTLPSVTIKVKSITVKTDENGRFEIPAKAGDVLLVSSVGFETSKMTVGKTADYSLKLHSEAKEVEGVVVTAFGIKRSVKTTTYSAQQISAEKLTQTRETDLTTALAGKVAGLQVLGESGSKMGASGNVRLRGVAGFDDVYALYVVDGTIYENATDINMDDVENVSVLKGPNATALYGQRAVGGVIIITTKKAAKRKPIGVQFNSSTTFDQVAFLPAYQNTYGGGYSPTNDWAENAYKWDASQPAEWKVLDGYRRPYYTNDASWGPKFDGGSYIPWYAWYGGHADAYKTAKWDAQPNNINDFYRTGVTLNNNISISKGGEKWSGRFGYTNIYKSGIMPESDQTKHLFSLSGSYEISKALTVSTNINYSTESFNGDVFDAYAGNTIGSFSQWFHRDIDMSKLKSLSALKTASGKFASWNIDDSKGMSADAVDRPSYWYNPYTWLENLSNKTTRNRLSGDVSIDYKISKKLSINGAYRLNLRTTNTKVKLPYSLEISQGTGQSVGGNAGQDEEGGKPVYNKYRNDDTKYTEANYELMANYKESIKNFTFDFLGGGNILDIKWDDSSRSTSGGLKVKDVYAISNSKSAPVLTARKRFKQVQSLFFKANIGYKDFIFLDITGRNDWTSTLPLNNNSYFYPSIGTSFLFNKFIKNRNITFAKFRASIAQIGSDPLAPYANQFNFTKGGIPHGNDTLVGVPGTTIDHNIKSPLNTSYETGIDMKFFKNRVGFSFTYYNEKRENEIISSDVSSASGFRKATINAGQVTRKGIELELNFKPIVTKDFDWDLSFNWATNTSTVDYVSPSATQFVILGAGYIETFTGGLSSPFVYGVAGKEWGSLIGKGIKRMNGKAVLSPNGDYVTDDNVNFGNVLPIYNGGMLNVFKYKNFTLSAAIDFQCGGKYASLSDLNGKGSGLYEETAAINDKGKNVRDAVEEGGGVHVFGVLADGKPFDKFVNAYHYFNEQLATKFINDFSVFDASYIKFREISFGYNIPISKTGFLKSVKSANVSFIAKNVMMIYATNKNIDPTELVSNFYESGQLPGTRSYGFSLKLNF